MPALEKHTKIEDGIVMGFVSMGIVGCRETFEICTVEEWVKMSEEEAEKLAQESLWCSGIVDWGY